jgi:hypothetical protein
MVPDSDEVRKAVVRRDEGGKEDCGGRMVPGLIIHHILPLFGMTRSRPMWRAYCRKSAVVTLETLLAMRRLFHGLRISSTPCYLACSESFFHNQDGVAASLILPCAIFASRLKLSHTRENWE